MTMTAAADEQPAHQGEGGDGDHDRDEHGGDPVGQALDRGLAGLGVGHQPGDLGQSRRGAGPGGLDHEATRGVHSGAGRSVAWTDLDGDRLARQHRLVDGRGAGLHDAVGGGLLLRAHDEAVPYGRTLVSHRLWQNSAVAGFLHRPDEVVEVDLGRVEGDGGVLAGEVDRGGHAVHLVEALLDAGRARRARHAGDGQLDVLVALGRSGVPPFD